MCGYNNNNVNEVEFAAGCNRFGLDNPTPIVTKRLSLYGNTEDVENLFNQVAKRVKERLDTNVDTEIYTGNHIKRHEADSQLISTDLRTKDYQET